MKKKSPELRPYDSANYLTSEARITSYLNAAFAEAGDDPTFIAQAFGVVARARGMSKIARKAGLSRAALYRALNDNGNPEFGTILKVANALGFSLRIA